MLLAADVFWIELQSYLLDFGATGKKGRRISQNSQDKSQMRDFKNHEYFSSATFTGDFLLLA